jgi:hypothetical protein
MEKDTPAQIATSVPTNRLRDVTASFRNLPRTYSRVISFEPSESGWPDIYDHIQGFVRTDRFSIFTVNQKDKPFGVLYIYNNLTGKQILTYKIPVEGMNHPSGAQAIGDVMVLGLQSQDYEQNSVCFLDIKNLNDDSGPAIELLPLSVPIEGQSGASVGITMISLEGSGEAFQYVLAVSGDGSTTVYLSSVTNIGFKDPNLSFRKIKQVLKEGYQGIQLLTQSDNKVFLIAFDSEEIFSDNTSGSQKNWFDKLKDKATDLLPDDYRNYLQSLPISFRDYTILYELVGEFDDSLQLQKIETLHVNTGGGDLPLALKPHCRYGSGIEVINSQLNCYISGREPYLPVFQAPVVDVFASGTPFENA